MWHDGLAPFFSWGEVILSEKPFWASLFVIACQLFIFPLWTILSEFAKDWAPKGNCGSTITSQWSPRLRGEWRLSTAPWQAQPFPEPCTKVSSFHPPSSVGSHSPSRTKVKTLWSALFQTGEGMEILSLQDSPCLNDGSLISTSTLCTKTFLLTM